MSVVFQLRPIRALFPRLRALKRAKETTVNAYRPKLKYHRHEVGGVSNDNSQISNNKSQMILITFIPHPLFLSFCRNPTRPRLK